MRVKHLHLQRFARLVRDATARCLLKTGDAEYAEGSRNILGDC